MKICLISNIYEPYNRGGAEQIVKLQVEYWSRDNQVILITTQPKGELIEEKNNLKIYRFRPLNIFYYLNDFKHSVPIRLIWHFFDIFNIQSALKTKKIIKQENPDLIIIHNLKGISYLIPRVINRLNKKIVLVIHDVQYAIPSGLIIKNHEHDFAVNGFLTKLYQKFCRWLLKPIKVVISPSKWLLEFYEIKGYFINSKRLILRHPVNQVNQINQTNQVNLKKIVYIGQIEKHKGIEFLLESIEKIPGIKLTIVGDGTLMKLLKDKYPQIEFTGKLNYEQLKTIFNENAYVIVPSLCYENSPTVIYESFSYGRPVIVADIGGAAELVKGENTGYTFEPGNRQDLLEQILKAVNNPNYQKMSNNCKEKVKNFTVNNYCKKFLEI